MYEIWENFPFVKKIPIYDEFNLLPVCQEHMVRVLDITSKTGKFILIGIDLSKGFYVKEEKDKPIIMKVNFNAICDFDQDFPISEEAVKDKTLYHRIIDETIKEAKETESYFRYCKSKTTLYFPLSRKLGELFWNLISEDREDFKK